MSVFTDAQAKATEKIRQYGGTIRIVRTSPVDDITGTGGVDTIVGTGKAIQTEYSTRAIDGDKIRVGDKRLLVEASVVMQEDDKVQFGGKIWTIKRIEELNLDGGTRIFAKVQVRA
nr:MAG TPA: Head Tail Attachment [Caudoviricetes sp.]